MERKVKDFSAEEINQFIDILHQRFDQNMNRHQSITWNDVYSRLMKKPDKMKSLYLMEQTGGEPDVIGYDESTKEFIFVDCSKETPSERRNVCYDREALESRKTYKPKTSAIDMANDIGIELLTEAQYRELQKQGEFDLKTSSWIQTPKSVRKLGGALFCDRRYNTIFVYHNGASSYYGVRGFRGLLKV